MTKKLSLILYLLLAMALPSFADTWYLYLYSDGQLADQQFSTTSDANVFKIYSFSLTKKGVKLRVHNDGWSSNYGAATSNITQVGTEYELGKYDYEAWLDIAVGTYDVTFNASTKKIKFSTPATKYTITYNAGNYGSGSVSSTTKVRGEAVALSTKTFLRQGYVQTGWSTSDNSSTRNYRIGDSFTTDANTTLYPYWEANVSSKYLLGGDLTYVNYIEDWGAVFKYQDGTEGDVFDILQSYGVNFARLRLYNDPTTAVITDSTDTSISYRLPNCTTYSSNGECSGSTGAYAGSADILNLATRAKNHNMKICLTFHLSDFWSNAGQQFIPKAWSTNNFSTLKTQVANHVTSFMQQMVNQGTTPEYVSIGNETDWGMLFNVYSTGKKVSKGGYGAQMAQWVELFNVAYDAVKAVSPTSMVIFHHSKGHDGGITDCEWLFNEMINNYGMKVDIIGGSYYPYWASQQKSSDNTPTGMLSWASSMESNFGKPVMIMETGYSWAQYKCPSRNGANYEGQLHTNGSYGASKATEQGQADFMSALHTAIASDKNILGYMYWDPIFVDQQVNGNWIQTGWAEKKTGGKWYYQSNDISNTTWFDYTGLPLKALYEEVGSQTLSANNCYLYIWSDNSSKALCNTQLTANGNTATLSNFKLEETEVKFCIRNSDWSVMLGWAQDGDASITSTGVASHLGYTSETNGWIGLPADRYYNITFNIIDQTITFEEVLYNVTVNSATGGTATASPTSAVAGATITLTATPTTGYSFTSWTVDGATLASATAASTTFTMPSAAVAVTPVFTKNRYTVTFMDGYTSTPIKTQDNVEHGTAATAPADPTRVGYTFAGWDNSFSNVTSALTVTATWTANTNTAYTVKHFQQNLDGTYSAVATETDNLSGTTLANVTPDRKSYEGFDAPNGQTVTIAADGSTVVTYYYTRYAYALTWNLAGGAITSAGTPAGDVLYGASLTAPTVAKDAYDFAGWSPAVPATMPAKAATYTATWSIKTYTVTFMDGYTSTPIKTQENVEHGSAAAAPDDPTRVGYRFDGWDTSFDNVTSSLTVTATWTALYTISISPNNAEYGMVSKATIADVPDGTSISWNGNTFTVNEQQVTATAKTNTAQYSYEFTGWSSQPTMVDGNLDLVANFTRTTNQYTITFDMQGHGDQVAQQVKDYGAVVAQPTAPTASGYRFDGWYAETACQNAWDFATTITGNVTLYAKWTRVYTITYVTEGELDQSAWVKSYTGEQEVALPTPERSGYEFLGWYVDSQRVTSIPLGSKGNRAFTAEWAEPCNNYLRVIE